MMRPRSGRMHRAHLAEGEQALERVGDAALHLLHRQRQRLHHRTLLRAQHRIKVVAKPRLPHRKRHASVGCVLK